MVGAERRQVLGSVLRRGARASACSPRWSASSPGLGLAKGARRAVRRDGALAARGGHRVRRAHVVVSLLVGTGVTLAAGPAAGVARDARAPGRGAARRRAGRRPRAPARAGRARPGLAPGPPGPGARRRGGRARAAQRDAPARPHDDDRHRADDRRGAGHARHRRRRGPEGHDPRARCRTGSRPSTWSRARTAGRRPTRRSARRWRTPAWTSRRSTRTGRSRSARRRRSTRSAATAGASTGSRATTPWPPALGDDGAVVDEGWAKEHGLAVGDRFALTSATGDEARPDRARHRALAGDRRRGPRPGHRRPGGVRPRVRERGQLLHARLGRRRPGARAGRVPGHQGPHDGRVRRRAAVEHGPAPGDLLRAAGARRDRVAVRHRQHARAGDVRADAASSARSARSACRAARCGGWSATRASSRR